MTKIIPSALEVQISKLFGHYLPQGTKIGSAFIFIQIMGVATLPILARLYSANQFATFSLIFIASQLIGQCSAARYEQAIIIEQSDQLKRAAFILPLAVCTAGFLVLLTSSVILRLKFKAYQIDPLEMGDFLFAIPISGYLLSLTNILTMIAFSESKEATVAICRGLNVIVTSTLQISLALLNGPNLLWLVLGDMLGTTIALALLYKYTDLKNYQVTTGSGNLIKRQFFLIIRKYSYLPKANLPHIMFGWMSSWATLGFLSTHFSSTEAGYYQMMARITGLPAGTLGYAISNMYFSSAAKDLKMTGTFWGPAKQVLLTSILIGIMLIISFATFSTFTFTKILGSGWQMSGELAQVSSLYVGIHFVLSTLAPTPMLTMNTRLFFILSVIQMALFFSGLVIFSTIFGTLRAAVLGSTLMAAPYMIGMVFWHMSSAKAYKQCTM